MCRHQLDHDTIQDLDDIHVLGLRLKVEKRNILEYLRLF